MSELRYYGFKIHVQNEDGTTKVKQFRRAVSDVDDTVEMLNSTLADNVRVTASKTQTDKEAAAQARMLVSQQERQKRKTQQVVDQYTRLNQTIRQYGDNAEVVNAITRLGSNATEAQKQEVAELVQEYQRLRNAGDATRGSFRNLRGVTQNLGWQLQDVAVQAQMGTSWFTIIAQQGSQMAAAFGATGALIGAGMAIGFAALPPLIAALGDAEQSVDELKESQDELNKVFEQGEISVDGLSTKLKEMYEVDKSLAELKLTVAMAESKRLLQENTQELDDFLAKYLDLVRSVGGRGEFLNFTVAAEALGVTNEEFTRLRENWNQLQKTGDASALQDTLRELSDSGRELTPELITLIDNFVRLEGQIKLNEAQQTKLKEIFEGTVDPLAETGEEVEDLALKYNRMTAELRMTQREQALYNFWMDDAADLTAQQRDEVLQSINAYFDQKEAIEASNEALEQRKQLEEDLSKVQSKLDPSRGALDTVLNQVETLKSALDSRLITEKQFQLLSGAAWKEYYDYVAKLADDGDNNIKESTKTFQENIRGLWDELNNIDAFGDFSEQQKKAIEELATASQQQLAVMSSAASMFGSTIDEMVNGTERVREATKDMNGAQKAAFILMRSIAAAEAVINGLLLGMKLATTFANPALFTIGAGLGAASAGAIMGTTFAGAFDKGGYIPSGQMGIVSEYGDELVNGRMVAGPARVVGREETARRQGGDGGQPIVKIYNAPGHTAEVSQNNMGETEVRIIAAQVFNERIDSGVAGVLSDSRSRSTKAMKNNYQAPRKI